MCVCVCASVCECVCVHTCSCIFVCMFINTCVCLCVSASIHVYVLVCVCVCMPVREHLCRWVSLCVCLYCTTECCLVVVWLECVLEKVRTAEKKVSREEHLGQLTEIHDVVSADGTVVNNYVWKEEKKKKISISKSSTLQSQINTIDANKQITSQVFTIVLTTSRNNLNNNKEDWGEGGSSNEYPNMDTCLKWEWLTNWRNTWSLFTGTKTNKRFRKCFLDGIVYYKIVTCKFSEQIPSSSTKQKTKG